MRCPRCFGDQQCPCESCKTMRKEPATTWVHLGDDGMEIACGHCGFTQSADEWEDQEWARMQWINQIREERDKLEAENISIAGRAYRAGLRRARHRHKKEIEVVERMTREKLTEGARLVSPLQVDRLIAELKLTSIRAEFVRDVLGFEP